MDLFEKYVPVNVFMKWVGKSSIFCKTIIKRNLDLNHLLVINRA